MMDWDVDMEDAAGGFPPTETAVDGDGSIDTNGTPSGQETSTVNNTESTTLASNKVHIRGLDTMSTENVRELVKEHFGPVDRVEWIDDESANLLFSSDLAAHEALQALSSVPIADVTSLPLLETVPAKTLASKPDISLHVRLAVLSDKKAPGAASRSRYYLMNPDQDPEERRRRQRERRYRGEGGDGYGRSGRARGRRASDELETFDAGMYDDDEVTIADRAAKQRRRRSHSRDYDERRFGRQRNQDKELFPSRSRNRSASPLADRGGDAYMDTEGLRAGTASNRHRASGLKERLVRSNSSRELFPTKSTGGGAGHMDRLDAAEETTRLMKHGFTVDDDGRGDLFSIKGMADMQSLQAGFTIKGAANAKVTELFPDKFGSNKGKELLGGGVGVEGRSRRKKAEDLFY